MFVFPAVFVKNGRCRERAGFTAPVKLAKEYENMGAAYLHIIDMDGAMIGHPENQEALQEILDEVSVPVQMGGGIRSVTDVERFLNMGADRVIIGTQAVGNPALVRKVIEDFGEEKIVVSIDIRDGIVVTDGFRKISSQRALAHAISMKQQGVKYISCVDASLKSHSSFTFIEEIQEIYKKTGLNIITMGHMYSLKELEKWEELNVFGVVLNPDFIKGDFSIKRAIELFQKERGPEQIKQNMYMNSVKTI